MRLVIALSLTVAIPAFAAARDGNIGEKASWEFTAEERIEQRIDPIHMRERAAASATPNAQSKAGRFTPESAGFAPARAQFIIDGRRNPELFLPSELFLSLIDNSSSAEARRQYRAGVLALTFSEKEFWSALEKAGAEFQRLNAESIALQHSLMIQSPLERRATAGRIEALELSQCRSRFEALEQMRETFGRKSFDRFLYRFVAPHVTISSEAPAGNETFRLLFIEGGCQ